MLAPRNWVLSVPKDRVQNPLKKSAQHKKEKASHTQGLDDHRNALDGDGLATDPFEVSLDGLSAIGGMWVEHNTS
jgi:hypothetical protein